jgi:hypothetical protein
MLTTVRANGAMDPSEIIVVGSVTPVVVKHNPGTPCTVPGCSSYDIRQIPISSKSQLSPVQCSEVSQHRP